MQATVPKSGSGTEPAGWARFATSTRAARRSAANSYTFGAAHFERANDSALDKALEGIGWRIFFLIDWSHARKRLLAFVGKADAIEVLREAAQLDAGHLAWLKAGGEQIIFDAMQSADDGAFRIGDRLDVALGESDAHAFLVEVLCLASKALLAGLPIALVADPDAAAPAHAAAQLRVRPLRGACSLLPRLGTSRQRCSSARRDVWLRH